MTRPRLLRTIAALALAPVLLGGCTSLFGGQPPLQFYTLSAKSEMDGQASSTGRPVGGPIFAALLAGAGQKGRVVVWERFLVGNFIYHHPVGGAQPA